MENTQTKYYTSKAAAELIEMDVSYLNMLARTKQVEATSVPGRGRTGYVYMFPEATVEKLMELKELKNNGVKAKLRDGGIVVEKEDPPTEEVSRSSEPKPAKKPRAKKEPIYDRDLAMYIAKEVAKAYEEGFREGLRHGLEIGKEFK